MQKGKQLRAEKKMRVAVDCIKGRKSQTDVAKELGVKPAGVQHWIARCSSEGSLAPAKAEKNGYMEKS